MNGFSLAGRCSLLLGTLLLGFSTARARGDAMPSYTVTDLGPGALSPTKDSSRDWVVSSADGRSSYAFLPVDNSLADPFPLEKTLPPFTDAPVGASMTYGNPAFAYSRLQGPAFLNQNGLFVTTHVVGVAGHIQAASSSIYVAQKQPDGSLGPATSAGAAGSQWNYTLWTSPNNYSSGGQVATPLALNNLNQILATTAAGPWPLSGNVYSIADLNKGSLIGLQTIVPPGWHIDFAPALDDQGRILLYGESAATGWQQHTLLLTPGGLSSAPVPVPEPSTLATIAIGVVGLAARRRRARVTNGAVSDAQ